MNLFEVNNREVQIEIFEDSKIFTIDNFYKHPDQIVYSLSNEHKPVLHKKEETPSFNGIHFFDLRHKYFAPGVEEIGKDLSLLCNQDIAHPGKVFTNCIQFAENEFNDYENNYWIPHKDEGFVALIYLNPSFTSITNLYEQLEEDSYEGPEHFAPWRPKHKYKILKQIEGRYNRLVMFDGKKFLHGMDISNKDYFYNIRLNQALFFH